MALPETFMPIRRHGHYRVRARHRDYQAEVDAYYGTKSRPARPPCPVCNHEYDSHPFGGACSEKECKCSGVPADPKPMGTSNSYAQTARLAKANKLAILCQHWKIRSYEANGFSEAAWGELAKGATEFFKEKVNKPSSESQALVIRMLAEREQAGAAALEKDRR